MLDAASESLAGNPLAMPKSPSALCVLAAFGREAWRCPLPYYQERNARSSGESACRQMSAQKRLDWPTFRPFAFYRLSRIMSIV
jgi:hypothetical protein